MGAAFIKPGMRLLRRGAYLPPARSKIAAISE
jgi:hypothetical protein